MVVSTISAKIQIKCLLINYGKMSKQRAKKYNKHKSGKKNLEKYIATYRYVHKSITLMSFEQNM